MIASGEGKYKEAPGRKAIRYDDRFMTLFPRMYSSNANHIQVYKGWGTIGGIPVEVKNSFGRSDTLYKPKFSDNLEFFFKYQVGYMYLRYFLWNFAGKQNDMQGNGGIMKGNWISGFNFIDRWFVGPQNLLPDYAKNNSGRNRYFLLPLLLGVGGMIFHFLRSRRYALTVGLLFLLTGLAIVVYTNQTPLQPRERDYVYTGSFYAFSVWIGMGVLWVIGFLKKFDEKKSILTGLATSLAVPLLLLTQNYDDHNRNGRVMVRDIAKNYLESCDKNAILLTAGDNDTYPLWYLQEVEGIRTDVRVINLMLLNADWYIQQQMVKMNESDALPLNLAKTGVGRTVQVQTDSRILSVDSAVKSVHTKGYIPTRNLFLPSQSSGDTIMFSLPGHNLWRSEVVVLDLLANFEWERPVYFSSNSVKGTIGLAPHLHQEGFVYRLSESEKGTGELYDMLMNRLKWEEWDDGKGLMDDHIRNMLAIMKVRQAYGSLALRLCKEGEFKKAEKVLDKVMEIMPVSRIPYDSYCITLVEAYYKCGSAEKAGAIYEGYLRQLNQELNFYKHLPFWMKSWVSTEVSHTKFYLEKLKNVKSPKSTDIN